MDEAIDAANRATTERLRAIAGELSDEELARPIDPPWTAAALLVHISFWDRLIQARWSLAIRTGTGTPPSLDDPAMDLVNDAALPQWLLVPPREAAEECVRAAASVDDFLGALDPERAAEVIAQGRPRLVDRSLHRSEHLATIESAMRPARPGD